MKIDGTYHMHYTVYTSYFTQNNSNKQTLLGQYHKCAAFLTFHAAITDPEEVLAHALLALQGITHLIDNIHMYHKGDCLTPIEYVIIILGLGKIETHSTRAGWICLRGLLSQIIHL
jgi:hypothetical protein